MNEQDIEVLRKVYEYMKHDKWWPDEITKYTLKRNFNCRGNCSDEISFECDPNGVHLHRRPRDKCYKWEQVARQFKKFEEADNDNTDVR